MRLALVHVLATPGVPLLHYGDEFGMPGAADPDNRRMMRFGSDLNAVETQTLAVVRQLGTLRAGHPALRTGSFPAALVQEAELLAWGRTAADETAVVVINRGSTARVLSVPVSGLGVADAAVLERAELGALRSTGGRGRGGPFHFVRVVYRDGRSFRLPGLPGDRRTAEQAVRTLNELLRPVG